MSRADLLSTLDRRSVAVALSALTIALPILFVVATSAPLDQPFAKDPKKSVGQVLAEVGGSLSAFVRFRVGA